MDITLVLFKSKDGDAPSKTQRVRAKDFAYDEPPTDIPPGDGGGDGDGNEDNNNNDRTWIVILIVIFGEIVWLIDVFSKFF